MRTKMLNDPYAPPKAKSPEQALNSLMALCARAEKSSGDARRLMSRWRVEPADQERVLEQLLRERFIDDERYATAFIREKLNLNGWGKYKIQSQLSQKGIAKEIIEDKIVEFADSDAMAKKLRELLSKRCRTLKYTTRQQLREKLIRYAASLGYDFSMVSEAVNEIILSIKDKEEDEECYDF